MSSSIALATLGVKNAAAWNIKVKVVKAMDAPKIKVLLIHESQNTYSPLTDHLIQIPALRGAHLARLRIIVADDNPAFLRELTSLLAPEFDVVATAANGRLALELICRYKPDLVVLDLGMPLH
jgi:PleD family two-component response regulator